jgi:hypothetical protein
MDAAAELFEKHPHFTIFPGECVEVMPVLRYRALKEGAVDSVADRNQAQPRKNWTDEIKAHTYFEARLLGQDRNANFFAFNSPARLYLTHYEVLKSEERRFALFQKTRKTGLILSRMPIGSRGSLQMPEALLSMETGPSPTEIPHLISLGMTRKPGFWLQRPRPPKKD